MNETNTHPNERDPEAIHVWDGTVKDDLKELINIIYTNKMHIVFGWSSIKYVWFGVILR